MTRGHDGAHPAVGDSAYRHAPHKGFYAEPRIKAWGFFGTMQTAGADPMQAWNAASAMIAAATGASPEGVRDFLDSRHGRHFADDVANELWKGATLAAAIEAATAQWMGWRINRRTSRDEGIPQGFPYLTGWVAHFQILDEMHS
jgi:hypothetical protein